jgi:hypothetical protein
MPSVGVGMAVVFEVRELSEQLAAGLVWRPQLLTTAPTRPGGGIHGLAEGLGGDGAGERGVAGGAGALQQLLGRLVCRWPCSARSAWLPAGQVADTASATPSTTSAIADPAALRRASSSAAAWPRTG